MQSITKAASKIVTNSLVEKAIIRLPHIWVQKFALVSLVFIGFEDRRPGLILLFQYLPPFKSRPTVFVFYKIHFIYI